MNHAYTYKIQPTMKQCGTLSQCFGCVRFIYNWGLKRKVDTYNESKKTLTYNQLAKELTALKQKLMDNVMQNMQGSEAENRDTLPERRLKADSRLIDDVNKKLDDAKNLNATLPKKLEEANKTLMLETMQFCYHTMQDNGKVIKEIAEWLEKTREQAKINAMEKANRESVNKQLYSYLHNIFGANIINIFDLKYDEMYAEGRKTSSMQNEEQKNKK